MFGGQKGIALFNESLSLHVPLVCLCSAQNETHDQLPYRLLPELPVAKWQFLQPSTFRKIKKTISEEHITHVIVEHPYYGLAAIRNRKNTGIKVIIHAHNIESERFRLLGKWWWSLLRTYEKWVLKNADLILFKTGADQAFAISDLKVSPVRCMTVAYGTYNHLPSPLASQQVRSRHGIGAMDKIILFAATLDYKPNAIAVENIFGKIAPALLLENMNCKIIICGRNRHRSFEYLNRLSHPAVIMAGEAEDIDAYFFAADAVINPVQFGGGTQTKNIDALAHHCNLVCFDSLVDEELLQSAPGKIFTAPAGDWEMFVKQVAHAIEQKNETPASFFETYNWNSIAKAVADRIRSL